MIVRILILSLAAVAVLVCAVTAVGYALPQNHVASREASLPARPEAIFDLIGDVARHPEWRPDVAKVEVLATEPLKWREYSGDDVVTFEATEKRRPDLLRVRITDPDLPFGGTWTYEVAPEATGTHLRITERGEVYNPIFRFASRFVLGHTSTIDRFISNLQRKVSASPR